LVVGIGTFLAIGLAGLAVIDRYISVAAAALCVFAGFAIAGFTVLRPGTLRTVWTAGAAVIAVAVIAFTLSSTLRFTSFRAELAFRTDSHDNLESVLHSPAVKQHRKVGCGPISTPTHKVVPDARLVLGLRESAVVARNDPAEAARANRGLALYVKGRRAMDLNGFDAATSGLTEVPPPGFVRIADTKYFTVYARCTEN
jgi:hypothetical protein